MEKSKKIIKGLVKAVQSGDFILIHKSSKSGPAIEHQVYLSSIQAPKMGSANRAEEPFGFAAREFLREKIVGRKCVFQLEYNYSSRDYGQLIVNDENMNLAIVKAGLAKVIEKKGTIPTSKIYEELMTAQNEAKQKKAGVWSQDEKYIQKNTRNVTYFSDTGYNANKIFEDAKLIEQPMDAIVEYVFNASFITLYVHKLQTVIKMSLIHLFTPSNIDKEINAEGKAFTEKLILHRSVGVKLEKVEEGGNLSGRIFHPAGDIAYEVVKNGYSKLNTPKNIDFDAEYYKKLKEAQLIAQSKRAKIWKDLKVEENKQNKSSVSDFEGKVVEVHSGDSVTVERESDKSLIRIFFTTVKAPAVVKKDIEGGISQGQGEPYGWDCKELLRKTVIGKKVRVVMEQSRVVQQKTGEDRKMEFGTIFLTKNDKNVSCILLEKGLLKTNVSKSGDNASKFLEDLLAAEKKATEAKLGLHSQSEAPMRIFDDITSNTKKSKSFEAMIMKRPNTKLNGVVEYCFSGMRFKVRLDSESTAISFSVLGIKTMSNDKNQPQMLELSNQALAFAKETLFQRDVIVDLQFSDKRGTFFGTLQLTNKHDYALMIISEGLAEVNVVGNKAPSNIYELEDAQEEAKASGKGIWEKSLKLMTSSPKKVKTNVKIQVEMTHIEDASNFYVRIIGENQYQKIDDELDEFVPEDAEDLEKPIKKGTICAAKFSVDERWYRASVIRSIGKGQFEVQFIDFGNVETVHGDNLKRLPQSLTQYEPQAKWCGLAFLRTHKAGQQYGTEAAKMVQKTALEKISEAIVVSQNGDKLNIVLFEKGEKDWNNSVNAVLLQEGLASLSRLEDEEEFPEQAKDWSTFEEEAKEGQLKIWQYGGAGGDSDSD